MDLDDLLRRYFGSTDLAALSPAVQSAGVEHALVDLGLEQDPGKRFALWTFLHLMGMAPDLDVAFEDQADREAARDFMDLMAAAEKDGER
ncbi:hypothetical protein [Croceibacterium aestuarii]|uniref:hypothetical protein n=1 Tax=Croceibacterium aestuarii TaxID=3064139 RepID=UPI00272E17CD|nr:hypothetical protein [Croceibacterium sp. D39]